MGTYQSKFTGEEIDGLLEEVRNGGAGGGASETVLWEGNESIVGTTLTLSDSIENYDYIYIETGAVNASNALRLVPPTLLKVSSIVSNGYTETIFYAAGVMSNHTGMYTQACLYFTGAKSLKFGAKFEDGTNAKNTCVRKVIGLKLGGGSSTSTREYGTFISNGTAITTGQTFTLNEDNTSYGVISTGESFNTISKDSSGNPILKAGKTYKISMVPIGFSFGAANGSFVAYVNMGETNVYLCNIMSASLTSHSTNLVLNDFYYKPEEDVSLIVKEGHPTHADSKSVSVTSYRFRLFVEEM